MHKLQTWGGIAALINGFAYIIGIGMVLTLLAPFLAASQAEKISFLLEHQTLMALWYLIIYLVAGVWMVPLAIALHQRMQQAAPMLMQVTTAMGVIWATTILSSGMLLINNLKIIADLQQQNPEQTLAVSTALSAVASGLGGAIELPGGVWVGLISLAGLQTKRLPKLLNYCGLLVGATGIATVFPAFYEAGSIFGIGMIGWFLWVGFFLVRAKNIEQRT
ncbi:DUF4386 family protein [Herpetosiphon llansteffanensis]|uniref:DUF4386 family protein n=1 Tax=Herpetosiphon llansteffanensis TaxID=2094568 RepID=UPI0013E01BFE|nr:DUF4386 family protein [Herpetosiphon llansteffanensis]